MGGGWGWVGGGEVTRNVFKATDNAVAVIVF